MKKYYGYFVYHGTEYVIRFKIDGSLRQSEGDLVFRDKDGYIRSCVDLIAHVAFNTNSVNLKGFFGMIITHENFIQMRTRGIKRWIPENEVIKWD